MEIVSITLWANLIMPTAIITGDYTNGNKTPFLLDHRCIAACARAQRIILNKRIALNLGLSAGVFQAWNFGAVYEQLTFCMVVHLGLCFEMA